MSAILDDPEAKALTLPSKVAKLGELAADLGWRVTYTFADGPPASVALKVARGRRRAFGVWLLADDRIRWQGGAANQVPGGSLNTCAKLRTYLEAPPGG